MAKHNLIRLFFSRLWIFISLVGLICVSTYFLVLSQGRASAVQAVADRLQEESALQASEIRQTLDERVMDLRLVAGSMEIQRFYETDSGKAHEAYSQSVSDWVKIFLEHEDAHIASFYDRLGHLLLRVHSSGQDHHSMYLNAELVPDTLALEDIRSIAMDLVDDEIFFNLIVPVEFKDEEDSPVGYIRLDLSVEKTILQWLKHPSSSVNPHEALLAKPIGENFYFFSPLREEGAVFVRSSAEVKAEPARQALRGETGFTAGLDYDGVPVFACIEYIDELDASLVVKLDQEAVMAPLRHAALIKSVLVGGGCLLLLLFLAVFAARRERRYASQILLAEQAKSTAAQQALLLKKAMDYATNLIYITDTDARLIYVNSAVLKVSGYQMDELLGQNPSIFKSGVHPQSLYEDMWQTLKLGKPFFCEVTNRRKDGSFWHQEGVNTPMMDEEGRITHYLAIHTDISERDELRDHLYRALDEIVEASRVKSEFMSMISHELRTPMNGIMGMIQLLGMTEISDEQAELLATAGKCSDSMMEIVDDLLDLTTSDRIVTRNKAFDLQSDLRLRSERWKKEAAVKQLALELRFPEELPARIFADRDSFFKLLSKLVSNAIKFSESGEILVRLEYLPEGASKGTLRVLVEDQGRGVPEDYREHLFKPFTQAESAINRSQGGLGLGLYLAQRIADSMGANLFYDEREAGGSIFGFELSVKTADANEPTQDKLVDKSVDISKCRVLVAEDDVSNQRMIQKMLERLKVSSVIVSNGQEVLDRMANESFDLLLLDCHMPILDGFETAKAIRGGMLKLHNPDLSIIALTADADNQCRSKCSKAGMSDFIQKPVTLQQIEMAIAQACSREGGGYKSPNT